MTTPSTDSNNSKPLKRCQIDPPTWKELCDMETSISIAESYLTLLQDILSPSECTNEPDLGLERFRRNSQYAMFFMIGDLFKVLKDYETLIGYSYETIKPKKEVIS